MIPYDELMSLAPITAEGSYTEKDSILYALGVGFMRDPLNRAELPFVFETNLRAVPSMAAIINPKGAHMIHKAKLNELMVVHGEQRIELHRPLPAAAEFLASSAIVGAWDRGADKGALLVAEARYALKDGTPLATVQTGVFARGDGGFGGPKDGAPEPHVPPTRPPDMVVTAETRPDQAFLYALCGDRNPLHRDPVVAAAAGYPRPVLHGLCTYGTACRALLHHVCNYDAARVCNFDARFSSPMFPGETLQIKIWRNDPVVSFECTVAERQATVVKNGRLVLRM